jgi:hypothetical protein
MKDSTPSGGADACPVTPLCRVGDEVTFKFEGNLRARVEGYEVTDGRVCLSCRATLDFSVPYSQIVSVEREG